MRAVPDVSEWQIRKIIDEVKAVSEIEVEVPDIPRAPKAIDVIKGLRPIEVSYKAPKVKQPKDGSLYTVAIFGDMHAPFHHEDNVQVAQNLIRYLADTRLDTVVCVGDGVDFYAVSRYDKDPRRLNQLNDELVAFSEVMAGFTEAAGGATKEYILGNHEKRLQAYIHKNAPALATLPQLQIRSLLGLDSLGWNVSDNFVMVGDLLCKHGEYVASASGATGKKEMDRAWLSGVSGHVHRLAVHYRTNWFHKIHNRPPSFWVESGCLCEADMDYRDGAASDWQPGVVVVRVDQEGVMYPELIPIHNGRTVYDGKVFVA
jgi:hypothetical protein